MSQTPLYIFAVVRENDNVLGAITHLVCKAFDEAGFYDLKLVDVEDIRHIDDDRNPIVLELCYLDLAADLSFENIVGTPSLLCRTQLEIDKRHRNFIPRYKYFSS